MTRVTIRRLAAGYARHLVDDLFRNGDGVQAERLMLVRREGAVADVDLGGWGRPLVTRQATDAIESAMLYALRHKPKRAKKVKPSGEEG